jgi:hypothetical protein
MFEEESIAATAVRVSLFQTIAPPLLPTGDGMMLLVLVQAVADPPFELLLHESAHGQRRLLWRCGWGASPTGQWWLLLPTAAAHITTTTATIRHRRQHDRKRASDGAEG